MNTIAHIVHELPGRTRVKMPAQRGNGDYFALVGQRLGECLGVTQVQVNVRTGSLLINYAVPFSHIVAFAREHQLFTLQKAPQTHDGVLRQASENLVWIDARIARFSEGSLDLRSLLLAAFLGLSLIQLYRGQILAPASSLLWYALQLLNVGVPARPEGR